MPCAYGLGTRGPESAFRLVLVENREATEKCGSYWPIKDMSHDGIEEENGKRKLNSIEINK